jgi:translation initiation factor IF-3
MAGKGKRVNAEIKAAEVAVISESGESLGTLSLEAALDKAAEMEMDLVEIGVQNGVVLAKIMDYGKFLFKQQKNLAHGRQSSKKADVKTLKITYKIGEHDLEIRRTQAKKFAAAGHPLKIMLTLRGRENQYAALAQTKMKEFINSLSEFYKTEGVQLSKTGNNFSTLIYPKK